MTPTTQGYRSAIRALLTAALVPVSPRDVNPEYDDIFQRDQTIPVDVPEGFSALFRSICVGVRTDKMDVGYRGKVYWYYTHPNQKVGLHPIGYVGWDTEKSRWEWECEVGEAGTVEEISEVT